MSGLSLRGGQNFREVQARTRDGRALRLGRLFRSGELCDLSAADLDQIAKLAITDIVDLRTPGQRHARPTRWPQDPPARLWTQDAMTSVGELRDILLDPRTTADMAHARMVAIYRRLPFEQADVYRHFFARLAAGDLPLLIHCTAGKDRTGIAIAFLLELLDVPRDAIEADFLLTDRAMDRLASLVRATPAYAALPADVLEPMLRADPLYLAAAFEAVEARHGNVAGYLDAALGIGQAEVAAIRANLLEPAMAGA